MEVLVHIWEVEKLAIILLVVHLLTNNKTHLATAWDPFPDRMVKMLYYYLLQYNILLYWTSK